MAKLSRLMLLAAVAVVLAALGLVVLQYPYLCLLLLAVIVTKRASGWRGSSNYGSARLATFYDLVRHRLVGDERGLILGRASGTDPPTRWQALKCLLSPAISSVLAIRMFLAAVRGRGDDSLIRVNNYVHLLTVAPSGAGKSTSVLVPNLLTYPGSVVVIDPKGELYKATAQIREKRFGHRIHRVDPCGMAGPAETSASLNPFDFIDEQAPDFIDELRSLADLMVLVKGTETEPHWNDRAIDILSSFAGFICGCEADQGKRNLRTLNELLSSPKTYREVIRVMQGIRGLSGVLALLGDKLTWLKNRELNSVLSTVSRHIGWLDSPAIIKSISSSSFDPRWLWHQKETVYLILPHDKITTLAPLMRVFLGTILKLVSKNGFTEKYPVMFMVDEAAHLGRLRPLEEAITLHRGSGLRFWLFLQSLDQLKKCYGEAASEILDNLGTQQYFGITSYDTADHISRRIGDATIMVESINRNTSYSRPSGFRPGGDNAGSISSSEGVTLNETARKLIKPEEALVLPRGVEILFHGNARPIMAHQVHYYNAPEFVHDRTGRSRRFGFAAVLVATLALAASLFFARVMIALPSPELLRQAAFAPSDRRAATALPRRQAGTPSARRRADDLPIGYDDPLYGPVTGLPASGPVTSTQGLGPMVPGEFDIPPRPLGPIIREKGAFFGR